MRTVLCVALVGLTSHAANAQIVLTEAEALARLSPAADLIVSVSQPSRVRKVRSLACQP